MPDLYVLCGNIGTGKSSYALTLKKEIGGVVFCNDKMIDLLEGEYAYDLEKKNLYNDVKRIIIKKAILRGYDCIIDRTNITKEKRKEYIDIGNFLSCDQIVCVDFGKGEQHHLYRRLVESKGVGVKTWLEVFNKFEKQYEEPTEDEGFTRVVYVRN